MENTSSAVSLDDGFRACADQVEKLSRHVAEIQRLLDPLAQPIDLDGWEAVIKRLTAYRSSGGRVVLVATLYGPTGAGKSTLFRLMTGIPVPAGDDRRPYTHSSAAAVPASLSNEEHLRAILPGFDLEPLASMAQLTSACGNVHRLLISSYTPFGQSRFPLILIDVPDFDSVKQIHWVKASASLARAEVVLFIVQWEKRGDAAVVKALQRACRIGARLAMVVTKILPNENGTPFPERVAAYRRQLLADVQNGHHGGDFHERRADGRSLHEFLALCDWYFSPYFLEGAPSLDRFVPLQPGTPSLPSILSGMDGERVLLDGLMEPSLRLVRACRKVVASAERRIEQLDQNLKAAEELLRPAAVAIVKDLFPDLPLLQFFRDEAERRRNSSTTILTRPLRWLGRGIGYLVGHIRSGFERVLDAFRSSTAGDVREREEIERARLRTQVDSLIQRWRSTFPEECKPNGLLCAAVCARVAAAMAGDDLPSVGLDWEKSMRAEARSWAEEHPTLCYWLPLAGDLARIAGVLTAVGVMFVPVAAPVLVAAGGAGGGLIAGEILEYAKSWKMEGAVAVSRQVWFEQRSAEFEAYLRTNIFEELFRPWLEQRQRLRKAPLDDCRQAGAALVELARGWEVGREVA